MPADTGAPFAPGSISFRSYPNQGLSPTETIAELLAQATLAAASGFDGVMTSEHHGGFAGYLPNPLQLAGFLLDAMPRGWAAPCPLLLPLRPPALVAEETAWLAARFPGRVGLGVAAGALPVDFEIMGVPMDDLTERFAIGLALVAGALRGACDGPLAADAALVRCAEHPIPVVSAAATSSSPAVKRAVKPSIGTSMISKSTASAPAATPRPTRPGKRAASHAVSSATSAAGRSGSSSGQGAAQPAGIASSRKPASCRGFGR